MGSATCQAQDLSINSMAIHFHRDPSKVRSWTRGGQLKPCLYLPLKLSRHRGFFIGTGRTLHWKGLGVSPSSLNYSGVLGLPTHPVLDKCHYATEFPLFKQVHRPFLERTLWWMTQHFRCQLVWARRERSSMPLIAPTREPL